MSREDIAQALDEAAEALARAAHAMRGSEPDAARASVPVGGPAVSAAGAPPPAPAARPPYWPDGLDRCPIHGVAWSVQRGGISKRTGKRYSAFWKCAEKDGENYCNEKPVQVWADSHPAVEPSRADDDLPF